MIGSPRLARLVRLEIPDSVHRDLRVVAAMEGLPMSAFARAAVERAVAERVERYGLRAAKRGRRIEGGEREG